LCLDPPGNYDRLLGFSRSTTGSLFFVPPSTFLGDAGPAAPSSATLVPRPAR
jgi:putative iron-dependent peroxidase